MTEELKVIISAEVGEVKKGCQEARKEIEEVSKTTKTSTKDMLNGFKSAGDAAKTGLKVVAGAIAGIAVALLSTGAATEEYRQAQAKLNAAFDSAGLSAGSAKSAYNELYSIIGDSDVAVEASQQIALLADSEEEVAKWSELAAGVVGKFGDALQPETFYESANETLKLGEATGAYVQMLEGAGVNVDDFNEKLAACNTEQEKQQLLFDTANGILGGAGDAYREAAAGIIAYNEAQAKMDEAMAGIGEAMQPIMTALMTLGADILTQLQPYIQEFAEKYLPQITEVLSGLGTAIGEVLTFVAENWTIISTIGAIILGIATALSVFSTVMTVVNAVMLASPVTWVVLGIIAAITALVAIIVVCIKHWEEIKEVVIKVWDKIKSTVKAGVDAVVGFFEKVINWIKENWQGLLLILVNPIAGAFKLVYDNCEGFRNKVDTFVGKVKEIFSTGFNAAKNTVVNIFNSIKDKISNILEGAKNIVKNVIDKIKSFFKFEWSLPKLKMPHVKISGSFSLAPPQVPKFSIDWYAKGGVFDTPTLFGYGSAIGGLGEAGAEAVVPLEKNTGWMDKIAERIGNKIGNTPVVLQVDGKTFATTSISCINDYTRQTGHLALNIF